MEPIESHAPYQASNKMPSPSTPDEAIANEQEVVTGQFFDRTRSELEQVERDIAQHERALHALHARARALHSALNTTNDAAPAVSSY